MGINKHTLWSGCICFAVILMVSGCATVAMMPETLDAEAKRFSPAPDRANIYVVRPMNFIASALLFRVYVEGEFEGSLAPGTYFLVEVVPGTKDVAVLTEQTQKELTLSTEGGENYFVKVTTTANVETLSQEEGRKAVEETKRAQPLGWHPTP